jgi:hypothetical protein
MGKPMTKDQLAEVSKKWLSPIDEVIADLVDKSHRMTAGAFNREVDEAIRRIPDLWDRLGIPSLEESLNDAMVEAFAGPIKKIQFQQPEGMKAARSDVDLRPTEAMAKAAAYALEIRRTKPPSQRGMTAVGIARARDISNRVQLSVDTIKRMISFFARHEVDKKGSTWDEKGKGWQAWNGWGGDPGRAWAIAKLKQLERE